MSGRHPTKYVSSCGKRRFRDGALAKAAVRTISRNDQPGKKPIRAYQCEECGGGWHLTSRGG